MKGKLSSQLLSVCPRSDRHTVQLCELPLVPPVSRLAAPLTTRRVHQQTLGQGVADVLPDEVLLSTDRSEVRVSISISTDRSEVRVSISISTGEP